VDGPGARRLVGRRLPRSHPAARSAPLMRARRATSAVRSWWQAEHDCPIGRERGARTLLYAVARGRGGWAEGSTSGRLFDEATPRGGELTQAVPRVIADSARTASCSRQGSRTARNLVDTAQRVLGVPDRCWG